MPPSEPRALATVWARKILNTGPGGDGGFPTDPRRVQTEAWRLPLYRSLTAARACIQAIADSSRLDELRLRWCQMALTPKVAGALPMELAQ